MTSRKEKRSPCIPVGGKKKKENTVKINFLYIYEKTAVSYKQRVRYTEWSYSAKKSILTLQPRK